MTSEDEIFTLYLSNSDSPASFQKSQNSKLNTDFLNKFLPTDLVEEALEEGLGPVINKKLILNPFFDETFRSELFKELINSIKSDDYIEDVCRESYLRYNLNVTYRNVFRKTDKNLNWKEIKKDSMRKIYGKFIDETVGTINPDTKEDINNKLFKS